jgi:nucleoside triphosphate pyrophosphatase
VRTAYARDMLFELRGKTHQLHSAVALADEGTITWANVETTELTMRSFSAEFIGRYLAATDSQVCEWPGEYRLDGLGIQLFDRIDGGYLVALGVPILPLFARLREHGFNGVVITSDLGSSVCARLSASVA